jgi:flagellin
VNFGDLATNNVVGAPTLAAGTSANNDGPKATYTIDDVSAGDIVSFKTDAGNYIKIELDAGNITALNGTADDSIESSAVTGTLTGTTAGTLTLAITGGNLVVSGADTTATNLSVALSDVTVSRGHHAPVAITDITTSTNADSALTILSTAIDNVNSTRAGLGASMSRLEFASDNLQNVAQNSAAARSRVLDADYASETTELARTQIIQQAATAMLAQANQSQAQVLALLKS